MEYDIEPVVLTVMFLILDAIGLHGLLGMLAAILLVLGFFKLAFGRILFCRKTKAQAYAKEMKLKGIKEPGQ